MSITREAVVKGDGRLLPVEAVGGAKVLADCWNLGTKESRGPAIVVNTYGKGRTVYISGSLEAHYASSRVPSHRRILASAVRYLAGDAPPPFTISAPRGVYGVLRRAPNADLTLWLMANVGFKDAALGRMRQEYMPVSNVEVRILVPEGRGVKGRASGAFPRRGSFHDRGWLRGGDPSDSPRCRDYSSGIKDMTR